jgi:hypothetical protein
MPQIHRLIRKKDATDSQNIMKKVATDSQIRMLKWSFLKISESVAKVYYKCESVGI